jgi:hypothetical protein
VIEWKIAAKPCLEVKQGKYWNPKMGVVEMGLNFEIQDLDEKERGTGNWNNMHHVDVWAGKKGEKGAIKNWGSLVIYPDYKPANLNSSIRFID